jgi:hypothetical protein
VPLTILAAILATGAAGAPSAPGIERVAWLQGCWQSVAGDRLVEEQWTAPRAGSMLSTGRTVQGNVLREYEFVIVRERGDALVYFAHPSGQPAAEFVSTMVSDNRVVFENLQHDFPQRVGYERTGASSLDAWIEGSQGSQTRRINLRYQRVSCPNP